MQPQRNLENPGNSDRLPGPLPPMRLHPQEGQQSGPSAPNVPLPPHEHLMTKYPPAGQDQGSEPWPPPYFIGAGVPGFEKERPGDFDPMINKLAEVLGFHNPMRVNLILAHYSNDEDPVQNDEVAKKLLISIRDGLNAWYLEKFLDVKSLQEYMASEKWKEVRYQFRRNDSTALRGRIQTFMNEKKVENERKVTTVEDAGMFDRSIHHFAEKLGCSRLEITLIIAYFCSGRYKQPAASLLKLVTDAATVNVTWGRSGQLQEEDIQHMSNYTHSIEGQFRTAAYQKIPNWKKNAVITIGRLSGSGEAAGHVDFRLMTRANIEAGKSWPAT